MFYTIFVFRTCRRFWGNKQKQLIIALYVGASGQFSIYYGQDAFCTLMVVYHH